MPKAKVTRRKSNADLRRRVEEQQLRLQLDALEAQRKAVASLATYRAAERGRLFTDWRAPVNSSADYASLNDAETINARARQLVRDSWIAQAAVRAVVRNTAGRGVEVRPKSGDAAFDEAVKIRFAEWAQGACDMEGRRTWWQYQQFAVAEEFTVGEALMYVTLVNGVLKLMALEPELLDDNPSMVGANEIRGGVEVDAVGRIVAYHVKARHDTDYRVRGESKTYRIPVENVLHFARVDRAKQTRGVSKFAPVMADIWQLTRFDQAHEVRKRMEACIGLVIRQTLQTPASALLGLGPAQSGQSATTAGGERAFEMAPGMTPILQPGEDVTPYQPSQTATEYATYFEAKLRGIGAALGLSYGALFRRSDGNYSSARQDMLEDERELRPAQDALIDQLITPVYTRWVESEVAGGRLPVSWATFNANRSRYLAHDAIPPVRPWIDPEKEANAYEKLLGLNLTTREKVATSLGDSFAELVRDSASEKKQLQDAGLSATASAEAQTSALNGAQVQSAVGVLQAVAAGTLGVDAATGLLAGIGIDRTEAARMAKETAALKAATPTPQPTSPVQEDSALASTFSDTRISLAQLNAPNYRAANSDTSCGSCRWFKLGICKAHGFTADPAMRCDDWEKPGIVTGNDRPDGEPPIDTVSARDNL